MKLLPWLLFHQPPKREQPLLWLGSRVPYRWTSDAAGTASNDNDINGSPAQQI